MDPPNSPRGTVDRPTIKCDDATIETLFWTVLHSSLEPTPHCNVLLPPHNKANDVKFMHQSLCNLSITSLINAINTGFLNGALHLNAKSIQKFLAPSPTTLKGHTECPHKGIRSTTPKPMRPSPLQVHITPNPQ